ncbi:MAG: amino acid adenylation domain-containing protein, partial [Deltaproteobacteria bacterium]|nr:amino acid adenylation domain-containing protein [Deltaproteobacteria bacterium]
MNTSSALKSSSLLFAQLQKHVGERPDEVAFRILPNGSINEALTWTWAELFEQTERVARVLQSKLNAGDRALLLYDTSLDFIASYMACLGTGVIAVPVPPPDPSRPTASLERLRGVISNASPGIVLSSAGFVAQLPMLAAMAPDIAALDWLATDGLEAGGADPGWHAYASDPDAVAMLQYTSGSTGHPKGVMLTQHNLAHNTEGMGVGLELDESTRFFSWMPLFHDFGLIAVVLSSIRLGAEATLMSPLAFLQKPERWLQGISHFKTDISCAPNFAYALCVSRCSDELDVDLSHWRIAGNGAEPIQLDTLEAFLEKFEPKGFKWSAYNPMYGLAESTVAVTCKPEVSKPIRELHVSKAALLEGVIQEVTSQGDDCLRMPSVGRTWLDQEVRIVAPASMQTCTGNEVGEILLKSGSVARGYWQNEEETNKVFLSAGEHAGFIRTGDMGIFRDGQIYVTGRLKDLLIVRGQNHWPQDLEKSIEGSGANIRPGSAAAVADSKERVYLFAEVRQDAGEADIDQLLTVMTEVHGVSPYRVVLLRPKNIKKTTSGKLRRKATLKAYEAGKLKVALERQVQEEALAKQDIPALLARITGKHLTAAEKRKTFSALGYDSATLAELTGLLAQELGRDFSPTLLYSLSTPEALIEYLQDGQASSPDTQRASVDEPIAIIGAGCRFPEDIESPQDFFQSLLDSKDFITEVPADRWDGDAWVGAQGEAGKTITKAGGFIEGIAKFDASYFGLGGREASEMDPQHRLALEVTYHALEQAGMAPDSLSKQEVGVYFGAAPSEYALNNFYQHPESIGAWSGSGVHPAALSGRLSYLLGLRGPALTVDTACSSSLMALHLACAALRQGECSAAIAGGVNVMLTPHATVYFSTLGALSPTGRCRSFSADADGYVRSEGAVSVVLKRLSDAQRDGDTIWGVVRGTASNHDGQSNGFTAPSGTAQQAVMRKSLAQAGIDASEVGYVEAHGTGTPLGDAIEAESVAAVYGKADPIYLGAVKSQVGHTEAAAGLAGLLKVVMALQKQVLPPNLHLTEDHPQIDAKQIILPRKSYALQTSYGAVSSFGFTGTNVHVILEKAPDELASKPRTEAFLALSGQNRQALEFNAAQLKHWLEANPEEPALEIAEQLSCQRSQQPVRLGRVVKSREELLEVLKQPRPLREVEQEPKIAFLYSGQGSASVGMGFEFGQRYDVFNEVIEHCHKVLGKSFNLKGRLIGAQEGLLDTRYTQAALLAFETALTQVWKSVGIEPVAVLGHSLGAFSAAVEAGSLNLDAALHMLVSRGEHMSNAPAGGMLAIRASVEEIQPFLEKSELSLTAHNGPASVVLGGAIDAVRNFSETCKKQGFKHQLLDVERAFHSSLIQDASRAWAKDIQSVKFQKPSIPWVSDSHGKLIESMSSGDWLSHALKPIQFYSALEELASMNVTHCLEIGPGRTLTALASQSGLPFEALASSDNKTPEFHLHTAASLFEAGAPVRMPAYHGRRMHSPPTAYLRKRYWYGEPVHDSSLSLKNWLHAFEPDKAGGMVWREPKVGEKKLHKNMHVCVTGAAGGIGRALCIYLAQYYQMRMTLVGRSAREQREDELIAAIEKAGGEAVWIQADLTDTQQAQSFVEQVDAKVDILFHLAGTTGSDAMKTKRDSLLNIQDLTAKHQVLFSSISGVVPGLATGIEEYAAANAWLDDFAREGQVQGQSVQSIAWGPWQGDGMSAGAKDFFDVRGIRSIEAGWAFEVLEHALASEEPNLAAFYRKRSVRAEAMDPAELEETIRGLLAKAMKQPPESIDRDQSFAELGIDSLMALDLVKDIEEMLGNGLPTTLLYEHDTLAKLVAVLSGNVERSERAVHTDQQLPGLPLLPAQETFVVQHYFFPDMPANVGLSVNVETPDGSAIDVQKLKVALSRLVERHPVLTSAIHRIEDQWRMLLGQAAPALEEHGSIDEAELNNIRFDLEKGPMFGVHCDTKRVLLLGHHVLVDAWSQKLLAEDLLHLYSEECGHAVEPLPTLETGWQDVVHASHGIADIDLPWWKTKLDHGVAPIHLPWQSPVDAPSSGGCGQQRLTLDATLTERLQSFAKQHDVTFPSLVLAAYQKTLFDRSGQEQVTVRVAQGRREVRLPDIERVVGSMADSLPITTHIQAQEPLLELAKRAHNGLQEANAHGAVSSLALAQLGDFRACGPAGLTPFSFSFPLLPGLDQIGELTITELRGTAGGGFTRLTLLAWVFRDELHLTFNYALSHLESAQVQALLESVQGELVDCLQEAEESSKQVQFQIIERAKIHPDRVAVGTMTYGTLARRSAALAKKLKGSRIGILGSPSEYAAAAILAVLRTGAAWVPMDPRWPDARIQQVLESSQPSLLLCSKEHADRARTVWQHEVVVISDEESDDGPLLEGELSHIMYTSGSTGAPKGVMVKHASLSNWLGWIQRAFNVDETDCFSWTSSLSFGGTLRQLFSPLQNGARTFPVSSAELRDPDAFLKVLHDEKVTNLNTVPSLLRHLIAAADRSTYEDPFQHLEWVLIGGEAMTPDLIRKWRERYAGSARFANLYGSTETIVNASWYEIVREPAADELHVPVGWARSGVQMHLIDVVDGVGELAVSGAIAEGYWNMPEQTAAAFIEHPEYGRVYKTGDLARRLGDGSFVYLGRLDMQVQIYGNRVELAEVEHALVSHPAVDAAMLLYEEGQLIAAYQGQDEATPARLREFLSGLLPDYMVPHQWNRVDVLPRNTAGKKDRIALRDSLKDQAPTGPTRPGVTHGEDRQAVLAGIWQEVLQLPELPKAHDNFFELGGDSIRALEVLQRLQSRAGLSVRPMVVYEHQELGALSTMLEKSDAKRARPTHLENNSLSTVQRGFWTAHRRNPEHPPLWAARVPLLGELDPDSLQRALNEVVRRHPVLRTSFHAGKSGPVRRVHEESQLRITFDDLTVVSNTLREEALEMTWKIETQVMYPMETVPLFRIRVVKVGAKQHTLFFSAHHIIADAWSSWVLTRELLTLHESYRLGRQASLGPVASYADVAQSVTEVDDRWWDSYLADLSPPPPQENTQVHEAHIEIDAEHWSRLQARASRTSSTPFMLTIYALFRSLMEVKGTSDLVISTALSGREGHLETLAGVVGPFARALPIRAQAPLSLESVVASLEQAMAHSDASMSSIARAAGTAAMSTLGRYFLSWMDSSIVAKPEGQLQPQWPEGKFAYDTASTDTELMVGALVHDGLRLNLHGTEMIHELVPVLKREILKLCIPKSSLIVYAPAGLVLPKGTPPTLVEKVTSDYSETELIGIPVAADQLFNTPEVPRLIQEAAALASSPIVTLAGMLPSLTGLGAQPTLVNKSISTGHGATVCAMYFNTAAMIEALGLDWPDLHVGVLGYGSIGRSSLELCLAKLGKPRKVSLCDPKLDNGVLNLDECDL